MLCQGNSRQEIAEQHISRDVDELMPDELPAYHGSPVSFRGKHKQIKHKDRAYVLPGNIHTNTIENAFSLFKRGIEGNFHRVSIKHLARYLSELEHRFNMRDNGNRFEETLARMAKAKPMPFTSLTAGPERV